MPAYTRLFADQNGESHFEDFEIDLQLTDYAPPAAPLSLSSFTEATQFRFMNAPAGWSSDWHPAAQRTLFFVLSGEWEVSASDGETRKFGVGAALLVEDTEGKGHKSQVTSKVDSLAAMIQLALPQK